MAPVVFRHHAAVAPPLALCVSIGYYCILALLLMKCAAAAAKEYQVGGRHGWLPPDTAAHSNFNYSSWALRHKYYVGDSLEFNYPAEAKGVVEVNRQHFDACDPSDCIAAHGDGNTVVLLNSTGPRWFISGVGSNCKQGQKFGIMVFQKFTKGSSPTPTAAPAMAPAASPSHESPHGRATAPTPTNGAILDLPYFTTTTTTTVFLAIILLTYCSSCG